MLEEFIAFVYLYNQEFSVNINVVCLEKNLYHVCLAAVITYFVDDVILFLKTRIVLMKKKEANERFFFQSTSSDLMKCFMIDGCSNFNSKIFLFFVNVNYDIALISKNYSDFFKVMHNLKNALHFNEV